MTGFFTSLIVSTAIWYKTLSSSVFIPLLSRTLLIAIAASRTSKGSPSLVLLYSIKIRYSFVFLTFPASETPNFSSPVI